MPISKASFHTLLWQHTHVGYDPYVMTIVPLYGKIPNGVRG